MNRKSRFSPHFSLLLAACSLVSADLMAQDIAGRVLWVTGKVERVAPDGAVRPLKQGEAVRRHDVLRTAHDSHVQLVMADEALVALRPNSSLRIDDYRYAGPKNGGSAAFALMKGGFRSITGIIGREDKSQYRLSTPTASIGIRGTDHETVVAEAGTYNRVTLGATYLQSALGRVEVGPGETAFAASNATGAPFRLDRTPEFLHLAAVRAPRAVPSTSVTAKRGANGSLSPKLPSQAIGDNASPQERGLRNEDKQRGWERFGKIRKIKP